MSASGLKLLLGSWELHLRAERKSWETVKSYGDGVRRFIRWCEDADVEPALDRPTVNAFVSGLLDDGAEAATVVSRQLSVRRFSAWLEAEGEIETDELVKLKAPKLDQKVVARLTEQQIADLLAACAGKDFRERRDAAAIRFMLETMTRAGEIVGMSVQEIDLQRGLAIVRRGKGGKGRTVPFGPQTGQALDRYIRLRRSHRLATTPPLWLGDRGKGLGYQGLYCALKYRAEMAGIKGFHPHMTRHTGAQRWLSAQGSEGGLMAVAGWSNRGMLDRYTRATAAERAADEARGLNLGDF